jgi:thiamine transporter
LSQNFIPLRMATEISIGIALAVVLGLISKLIQMPYGGSINLSAVPLLILALRHGVRIGCITGGLYGVVDFLLNPFIFHPVQIILDYPIAFGLLGFSALGFSSSIGQSDLLQRLRVALGIILGNAMRLAAHFVSGMVFFAEYAPEDQPVWLYSLSYNASYIVPEAIIEIMLVQFILRFVRRA